MKITSVIIGPMPRPLPEGMLDPKPEVKATFDDGTSATLFSFYPDEISFAESDFVGLTRDEAIALFHRKDVAYLQAP